ncbi:flagellar biosynthetic protein FliO [Massilia sp. G4R7]|uniref:Flagellar protein n=1 Tax=Massilia phyllostachyos TaxID=2898585 RepID=A0ABS8Q1P1_9BURK|nr:flagellar biosynthetic protein FliO [Massilia phyllostachyos]MCD2515663.1 flagellar biosynthetic protein FliO [Massilia phyllostachyos]
MDTQPLPPGATTAGQPATEARPAPSPQAVTQDPALAPAPAQRAPQVVMPGSATPNTGGLLQTIFALVLVLGLLLGLAWFMKRFGPRNMMGGANVKLVGALNIGGRERIMVVEVGDQWIVVGASPGRVNALATMPRREGAEPHAQLAEHAPPAASFGDWLKKTIDKRNAN